MKQTKLTEQNWTTEEHYCKRCDMWNETEECEACGGTALTQGEMIDDAEMMLDNR